MTLPSSGPLSLQDIQGEFGGSNPISLSEYYGADSGVPSSGLISIGDFYGTSAFTPASYIATTGYSAGDFVSSSTIGISNSRQAGDLLVLIYQQTSDGTIFNPSGWTQAYNSGRQHVCYRTSNGTETSVTVTHTATNGRFASLFVFRDARWGRLTTIFSSSGNQNPGAVTAVEGGYVIASLHNVTGNEAITSNPSSYSTGYAPGPRNAGSHRSAYRYITSNRSENPGSFGGSISGDTRTFSIAVDPLPQ